MQGPTGPDANAEIVLDYRSFRTWIATSIVIYLLASGIAVLLLPFGIFVQYSIIVHTVVGIVATLPIAWAVYLQEARSRQPPPSPRRVSVAAPAAPKMHAAEDPPQAMAAPSRASSVAQASL